MCFHQPITTSTHMPTQYRRSLFIYVYVCCVCRCFFNRVYCTKYAIFHTKSKLLYSHVKPTRISYFVIFVCNLNNKLLNHSTTSHLIHYSIWEWVTLTFTETKIMHQLIFFPIKGISIVGLCLFFRCEANTYNWGVEAINGIPCG